MRGLIVCVIALSGCAVAARAGLTTSSSSSAGTTSSSGGASAPTVPSDSSTSGTSGGWNHPGMLVRGQLLPLKGMTVDQAKQRLAQLGFDGRLEVTEQYQYNDRCGQNKVCDIEPEAGIGLHDEFRLVINKKLEIAAPPP